MSADVFAELDALVTSRYPTAVAIGYSCVDDPDDVTIWTVRNSNGRLLWNWQTATGRSWPDLYEAVTALAAAVKTLPARGDGLTYHIKPKAGAPCPST